MSTKAVRDIPVVKIISHKQPREHFDEKSLAEMAETIRVHGVLQPIYVQVRGDEYLLIAGECRLRASKIAGKTTIPAIVEDRELTQVEILEIQIIENIQRVELTPTEKARSIDELMKLAGCSATQVASKLGMSVSSVSKVQSLLKVPEPIRLAVESGKLPLTAAYQLSRIEDAAEQAALAERLMSGAMTRDGLSGVMRGHKRGATKAKAASFVRVTALLGHGRSVTAAAAGLTLESYIELLEELLAKARKVRPQGLELSTFIKMLKDQVKE